MHSARRTGPDPQRSADESEAGWAVPNRDPFGDAVRPRVYAIDDAAELLADPHAIAPDGYCIRPVAHWDRRRDAGRGRDSRDRAVEAVGHPHRAVADRDRAGTAAHGDRLHHT